LTSASLPARAIERGEDRGGLASRAHQALVPQRAHVIGRQFEWQRERSREVTDTRLPLHQYAYEVQPVVIAVTPHRRCHERDIACRASVHPALALCLT
jgi:hypothetical protein